MGMRTREDKRASGRMWCHRMLYSFGFDTGFDTCTGTCILHYIYMPAYMNVHTSKHECMKKASMPVHTSIHEYIDRTCDIIMMLSRASVCMCVICRTNLHTHESACKLLGQASTEIPTHTCIYIYIYIYIYTYTYTRMWLMRRTSLIGGGAAICSKHSTLCAIQMKTEWVRAHPYKCIHKHIRIPMHTRGRDKEPT
jgi:hypothetical protein